MQREIAAAVILQQMPLDFEARDEPKFTTRALMDGHTPLLRQAIVDSYGTPRM
jgi:hypothetical protein